MKYKLLNFFGESIYAESKSELFRLIDYCTNGSKHSFYKYFTYDFQIFDDRSKKGLIKAYTIDVKETEFLNSTKYVYTYVTGHFKILDQQRYAVDLEILWDEYAQSRGLVKKNRYQYYSYVPGSKYNGRASRKIKCICKEYKDNIYAKEMGVKIRTKREQKIKRHQHRWDAPYRSREDNRCWKSKKKRKQWL